MTALNTASFAHPSRNVAALGVEPGMDIADFGSGSGAYVLAMAERMAHMGHIYAIDVQRELLRRIKNEAHARGYKNVEVIWSDLESPNGSKIADRHLDLVLISNLLFQAESKDALLAEAWRILKTKGRLAIIDWSEPVHAGKQVSSRFGPHKKDIVSKETMLELAKRNGFEFVKAFRAGAHHYGLIFRPIAQKI